MRAQALFAVLRLSRLPSCTVAFITVFAPVFSHTYDILRSLTVSAPIFTISMFTFILNDLNDIDRDRINHPDRPLPSGAISQRCAAAFQMSILSISILMVLFFVEATSHYFYFLIILSASSYSTVVSHFPQLKTFYVAGTIALGLGLVSDIADISLNVQLLVTAFLFVLGRELLMDIEDLTGDGDTLAKWMTPDAATRAAFSLQALGSCALFFAADAAAKAVAASIIAILLIVIIRAWHTKGHRQLLLRLMQIQMLSGIGFLL